MGYKLETPVVKATGTGELRIELSPYTFSPDQAAAMAHALQQAAIEATNLPDRHQNHVLLLASCALCVYESNGQEDRLTYDGPDADGFGGEPYYGDPRMGDEA